MGFRGEVSLGPNEGIRKDELTGATAGKGLVDVAASFDMV